MDTETMIQSFFVFAIIGMVVMGYITKSVAGAFIGFGLVCFATALILFQQGGFAIIGGIGLIIVAMLVMLLAFLSSVNYCHSTLYQIDRDGNKWTASQDVIGEGAKNASSHVSWDMMQKQPQQPKQIGKGKTDTRYLGNGE